MSHHHQSIPSALPPPLPVALDSLVDRLNASSGQASASSSAGSGGNSSPTSVPPIRALLVGTNEGSPLHRSFGTPNPAAHPNNANPGRGQRSHDLSEEVLCGVESLWTTLPSSTPPHVMAAAQAADAAVVAASVAAGGGVGGADGPTGQPPHPLLRPLGMGDEIRAVTAFYDTCTLVHVHMSPLVVTIVATPAANIGSIRTTALPLLTTLLNPIRHAILTSRRHALSGAVSGGGGGPPPPGGAAIGPGGGAVPHHHGNAALSPALMQQAFAAGFQAGSSLPDHHHGGVPVPAEYYHGR